MSSTFDLAAARSVRINGVRYICLTDTINIMGGDTDAQDVMDGFLALPEQYRAIHDLMNDSFVSEARPVVRMEGLVLFMRSSPQNRLSAAVHNVLLSAFEGMAAVSTSSQGVTRWGEQPFRELIRGYGQSMSEITALLNKHTTPDEKRITQASLSACAMGRQVPSPTMLRCLSRVLTATPFEMFAKDVLTAYEKKYGPLPSRSTPSVQPSAPVPDVRPEPVEYDENGRLIMPERFRTTAPAPEPEVFPDLPDFDVYDDEAEAAKMQAAFTEVLGMSPEEALNQMAATSFEAGFSTITGSPSAPEPELTPEDEQGK